MKSFFNRDYVENFVRYHKKTIIKVVAGFMLFVTAFLVFCIRDYENEGNEFRLIDNVDEETIEVNNQNFIAKEKANKSNDSEEEIDKDKENKKIYVDISGAVEKPYVYEMQSGSRVYEAIELAGGLKNDADVSNLNLAQVLKDEDKIVIFTNDEIEEGNVNELTKNTTCSIVQSQNDSQGDMNINSQNLININTATSEDLQTITGIGPSTAEKIISYRGEHGKFDKIEDIMNVSGIGEKTFKKFKSKITV